MHNQNQKLVLIRGLPGSGKTTKALTEYVPQGFLHFEADMFFMKGDEYLFDATKIQSAHGWCMHMTKSSLEDGKSVVVTNTFTRHWEMKKYLDMAKELGVEVEIIVATGSWSNVHGVPEETIKKMKERWEA